MKARIAINGYGRIGRCILRAMYESQRFRSALNVVAINELASLKSIAHLTRYDSTHGRFSAQISECTDGVVIDGDPVRVLSEPDPANLPWSELAIDLVLECTGVFKRRSDAQRHLDAGAGKVLFSNPAEANVDATVVYGVNHHSLASEARIVSNASCTTNAIVPVLDLLERQFGIECAMISTIHSAMHDQPVIDAYDRDLRKTRSALQSIIPVETALARGIARILPQLAGRISAQAIRVPTVNVSMMDLTARVRRQCDAGTINALLAQASGGELRGILGYSEELLVSVDFNHDPRSAIVDANQTQVCDDRMVRVVIWFDNEWGFANRMLDTAIVLTR
ncbi:MAG: erythrose-4-phosphate dehydrogenase [Gammaproteobacteria bacterium]|nr:erythrose-4-phosphate dehydrogenase [Gammaproteobacteria bacterium]